MLHHFSVRSEIVITGVGMNSLCNFTKYYSCEISLNVNFKDICNWDLLSLRVHKVLHPICTLNGVNFCPSLIQDCTYSDEVVVAV